MALSGRGNIDGFSPGQEDPRNDGDRSSSSDFEKLSKDISSNVQKITQNVSLIQRLVGSIGTPQDSDNIRKKVHQTTHYINQLAQDTSHYLKTLAHLPSPQSLSEQKQRKIQKERLTEEFSNALTNFQTIQRTAAEKEKASIQRARAQSGSDKPLLLDGPEQDGVLTSGYSQTKQLLIMEQDVDLDLMREREDAIKKLESDIMDVNQIFKDLGMLVHEQGEVLDSIEANIDSSQMNVEEGTNQLNKARVYQSKARKKKIIIAIIILIVLIIIGLIIYLSVK